MRNKILIFIILLILTITSFKSYSYAEKKQDLFNEILSTVKGNTVEYGIRVNFEIKEDGEKYCLDLLSRLNLNNGDINVIKDKNSYYLEFNKNAEKGYIECSSYDNHNVVTLNIIQVGTENGINALKEEVQKTIKSNDKNIKYYLYLKAKVDGTDISNINNSVEELLRKNNAKNIESVELENGFSTVAYTKLFKALKSNGKLIDLNYAVCNYSSGSYIIIGTPIIIEAY